MVVVVLGLIEAVVGAVLIVRAEALAAWARSRSQPDSDGSYLSAYQQPVAYRVLGTLVVLFAVFQIVAQS